MAERDNGETVSFFLRHDARETLQRMYESSRAPSRSMFLDEMVMNVAELGGLEKLKELRYREAAKQ